MRRRLSRVLNPKQNEQRPWNWIWIWNWKKRWVDPRSLIIFVAMSKKVLCKFFAHGACLKGDYCEFSHDWSDPPNNICTFYQKGSCSYGSRCRYDHVKASRPQNLVSSASNSSQMTYNSVSVRKENSGSVSAVSDESPVYGRSVYLSDGPAWTRDSTDHYGSQGSIEIPKNKSGIDPSTTKPANLPICSLAAAGNCPYGEKCPNIHGDLCSICGKNCLHPFRPDEREDHIILCQLNKKRLDALKHSQEIECSVCLDRVLSKPTPAERKFGILSECDHPFCISCIRNWRSNSPSSGMDVNSALRACPICRKLSYFVIPSVIWYFSKEEKQEIVDSYKAKLKSIDCRYFDFGNGTCPFGTSCFYKHAYRDGRLEEIVLRHLGAEDGNVVIARDIRLSDFLSRLHL